MVLNLVRKLARDKRGNFAIMTVVTFPMLFAGVALSVDVSNNLRLKTDLQNANDTAVLFATRSFQETKTVPTKAQVQDFVQANLKRGTASNVVVTFDTTTNVMTLTSESSSKPLLMNYFYTGATKVKVLSKATLGVSGILEFALALDTTWSMNEENRIGGLKTAANSFINMMMDVRDRGATVRGGIVPFERYVNVGLSNRNQSWMTIPAETDTRKSETKCKKNRIACNAWENKTRAAYTINHPAEPGSCWYEDGVKKCWSGSAAWTENVPARSWRECTAPVWGADICTTAMTSGTQWTWKGCVLSRMNGWNIKEAFDGQKFTGILDGLNWDGGSWKSCATEILPLTDSRSALLAAVSGLTPSGDTYIPEGIMWGTRLLTAGLPFTEASTDTVIEKRRALVVMTDGQNSVQMNQWGWHDNLPNPEDMTVPNNVTLQACNEAKSKGIEVYTVAFGSSVPITIRNLLKDCASKPEFNSFAANNSELLAVFKDIGNNLLGVRLSQ